MFLYTKLIPPQIGSKVIDRQRLLRLLHENEDKKIVLIIADAGYGKTTLISQWVKSTNYRPVFYGLGEEDSDFDLFLSHLIAGFEQLKPNFLKKLKDLIADNKELKNDVGLVMSTLINELQVRCKRTQYLILDDYHMIAESSIVHQALHYFIEHLPTKIHIIIASRVLPIFPSLVKWRSKQQVFEIERKDLCFSSEEVRELISGVYKFTISSAELERIEKYTEGWVTGIQMILQSSGLRRAAVKDTLNGFLEANQPLFEYFANEVLSCEAPSIQDFLIRSSVLETLTPQLCNVILRRKDSQSILEGLEHRHLFLFAIKEKEYKLHHLFRKFLNQRLTKFKGKGYNELQIRTAEYYRKRRFYDLSIRHYLMAKKYKQAGKMILKSIKGDIAGRISGNIDAMQLRAYISEIPRETLLKLPALLVIKGTLTRDAGEHEKAKELYRNAEKISRASKDMITCAHSLSEMALLHWLQGKHKDALAILKKALRICPVSGKAMRLHILNLLGLVWQDLSDLHRAKTFLNRARRLAENLNIFYDKIILESNIATTYLQEGEIKNAYHLCKPLIAQLGDNYYYKVGVIYANAARAAFDFGDLVWGEFCLKKGWETCRQYEDRVSHGTLNHCFGIFYMHRQQWSLAQTHFEEARKVFSQLRWRRMESSVLRNMGTLQRLQGEPGKSIQSVIQAENLLRDPVPQKTAHIAFLLADRALIEIETGKLSEALGTIARCLKQARRVNWALGEMYALLIKALVAIKSSRRTRLKKIVSSILEITKQKGYHGILSLELRHQSELLAWMSKIPDFKNYLDKHQLYYNFEQPILYVKFFGRMRVEDKNHQQIVLNWPTEKTKSLFAFLVGNRTRALTREQVLDALWPGVSRKKSQENLRTTAYRMRQTLKQANVPGLQQKLIFTYQRGHYVLLPSIGIESDTDQFDSLLKMADIANSENEKLDALKKSIEISREAYLSDIYDNWVDEQRSVLRENKLRILHKMIMIATGQGDHTAGAEYCREYLKIEPLSEEIVCILMESLKNLDRRAEITKVYQSLENALQEELKSTPTPETRDLYLVLMK